MIGIDIRHTLRMASPAAITNPRALQGTSPSISSNDPTIGTPLALPPAIKRILELRPALTAAGAIFLLKI